MNIQCIVFTVYRNGFPSARARAADTRFPLFAYEDGIRQDASRTRQAAKKQSFIFVERAMRERIRKENPSRTEKTCAICPKKQGKEKTVF